jgi:hypothetical protein
MCDEGYTAISKTLQEDLQGPNSFNNKTNMPFAFRLLSLMRVQWRFPEMIWPAKLHQMEWTSR